MIADGIACPKCGGATIAPDPARPEEEGDYCETCAVAWDRAKVLADQQPSPFRAPRVTTYTLGSKIHAIDTGVPSRFSDVTTTLRMVCGRELARGLMMRSSPTADAYVTCKGCAARLADGITVSAATVRRARLASQLADPQNH